jgi:nitrogen fixation/metabolism regulation signal transduction histidine kinase
MKSKKLTLNELKTLVKKIIKEETDMDNNVILIDDFSDFVRLKKDRLNSDDIQPAFRNGYWNVYTYNENLKNFLDSTDIKYRIKSFNEISK